MRTATWRISFTVILMLFLPSCRNLGLTASSSCSVRHGIARCFRLRASRAYISCFGRRGLIFGVGIVLHSWRSSAVRTMSVATTDRWMLPTGWRAGGRICGGRQNVSRSISSSTSRITARRRCIRAHFLSQMRKSFARPSSSSMRLLVRYRGGVNSSLKISGGRD